MTFIRPPVVSRPVFPITTHFPTGTRCLQVEVPDDPYYLALFYGQMNQLGLWFNYDRDAAHTGRQIAQLWKKCILSIRQCVAPPPSVLGPGFQVGEDMQIKQDPANPCLIREVCPDGSLGCTVIDLSLCVTNPAPGSGSTPPPPGGGTSKDCFTLQANVQLPLPWLVSTGDVLSLTDAMGAGEAVPDGWFCPDGSVYFLGACVGGGGTDSSDPLPTVKSMRLIFKVGSVYLDAMAGPVTIPSGISNVQPFVQVNDATYTSDVGQYNFCVQVTNNQTPPTTAWHAHIDLTRTFNPFTVQTFAGQPSALWVGGTGFTQNTFNNGDFITGIYVLAPLDSCTLTQMSFHCNLTLGDNSLVGPSNNQEGIFWATTLVQSTQVHLLANGVQTFNFGPVSPNAGITNVSLFLYASDGANVGYKGGSCTVDAVDIYGQGPKPSQLLPFMV